MTANDSSGAISEPKLTAKQEKAVAALLANPTIKEAAAAVSVSESSLLRWMREEGFRAEYMKARRSAVQQAITRAQVLTSDAMKALNEVVNDSTQPGTTRVSAAKAVMDYAIKGVELEDHEQRLKAIEAMLAEKKR